MTNKKITVYIVALIALMTVIFLAFKSQNVVVQKSLITNFEECKNAGFPVMESYPEQCRDGEGNLFVQIIENPDVVTNPPSMSVPAPSTSSAIFNKAVTLKINEVIIFPDNLKVELKEINDSRCPKDVQCVWAGELSALFLLSNGKLSAPQELRLGTTNNKTGIAEGYNLVLQSATENTATIIVSNTASTSSSKKCYIGGCSAQLCTDQKDMMSTCEYREEYACFKTAKCEVQKSGECGWTDSSELALCLSKASTR